VSEDNSRFRRRTVLGGMAAAAAAAAGSQLAGMGAGQAAPSTGSSGGSSGSSGGSSKRPNGLDKIEHVVILMQENRSFDHYFGTMNGIAGFNDPAAVRLPSGAKSVLYQPDGSAPSGSLLPWHVDTTKVNGQGLEGLDHTWATGHQAWNGGHWDSWIAAKGERTMAYFTEADVPFYRALAKKFTICDHYFCSVLSSTSPNRLYHWTGNIDAAGTYGGPAWENPPDYSFGLSWKTYPELLLEKGVSWQVFADNYIGDGSPDTRGDYGDNPLWLFRQYGQAAGTPLANQANVVNATNSTNTGNGTDWWLQNPPSDGSNIPDVLTQFTAAVKGKTLPKVSWIVAPAAYTDHPSWAPANGAAYLQTVLNTIWESGYWKSTVVFVNYDENDGFYDHVVSPTPPPLTPGEFLTTAGGVAGPFSQNYPIGLGVRVPMLVISPWTAGGNVSSQVFDHTSVLQFLEQWTGVHAGDSISAWRRSICGDLTSVFRFDHADTSNPAASFPDAIATRNALVSADLKLPTAATIYNTSLPAPDGPATLTALPTSYQPAASISVGPHQISWRLDNRGSWDLPVQAYTYHGEGAVPQHLTLRAHGSAALDVPSAGDYDVAVHAPNMFKVAARGRTDDTVHVEAKASEIGAAAALTLTVGNTGTEPATVLVSGGPVDRLVVAPGGRGSLRLGGGRYNLELSLPGRDDWHRHYVGLVETGPVDQTGKVAADRV